MPRLDLRYFKLHGFVFSFFLKAIRLSYLANHFVDQLHSAYEEIDPKIVRETAEHMVRFLS